MLVVRVELHSAVTGRVTEVGRMVIANDATGSRTVGNYWCRTYAKGSRRVVRRGTVSGHRRLSRPVWELVAKCLDSMGYCPSGKGQDDVKS